MMYSAQSVTCALKSLLVYSQATRICDRKACCIWIFKTASAFWLGDMCAEFLALDNSRHAGLSTPEAKGQRIDCAH